MAETEQPAKQPRADVPDDVRGAIITLLQFMEKLPYDDRNGPLDEMDLSDDGFDEDLQILKDAVAWTDGETYADDEDDGSE